MFTKEVKSHRLPSFPEIAALITAFLLGLWSLGLWTGLIASVLCFAEQKFNLDPLHPGKKGKIARALILIFVVAVLLHYIFPGTLVFDAVIRIFCICVLAGLVQFKLERKEAG